MREFEIRKDNELMANKITTIFKSKSPLRGTRSVSQKRSLDKTRATSEHEKWKIFKVAQDNQLLLKRLYEAQTCYDNKKYDEDFRKSLYYKKNICEYPEIGSKSLKNVDKHFATNYGSFYKSKESLAFGSKTLPNFKGKPVENIENLGNSPNQSLLFTKCCFFQDLFYCQFKFYVEKKKFVISVQPQENKEIIYFIIIEGSEEIAKMKTHFRNYEDVIEDLNHKVNLDLLFFKSSSVKLKYISLKTNGDSADIDTIIAEFDNGQIPGKRMKVIKEQEDLPPIGVGKHEKIDPIMKAEFEKEINSDDKEQLQLNNIIDDLDKVKEED